MLGSFALKDDAAADAAIQPVEDDNSTPHGPNVRPITSGGANAFPKAGSLRLFFSGIFCDTVFPGALSEQCQKNPFQFGVVPFGA